MSTTKPIRRVTIIGTGVIGASWGARCPLAKDLDVVATDISADADAALKRFVDAAWRLKNWALRLAHRIKIDVHSENEAAVRVRISSRKWS